MQGFAFSFDSNACSTCGGKCCAGERGYIFCSIDELLQISSLLKLPFNEFTQKYVKKVGYRFSLIEKERIDSQGNTDYACVFLNAQSNQCEIYEARPKQCRSFPFWDGFKNQDTAEFRELIQMCKGIRIDKKSF